ncbi:MAG: hypothetical protein ACHREM_22070 [Polyangiales bacterium]
MIEAKLLIALSDGASLGRKALLAKARIRSNDSERAYAVLLRVRAQGKVTLKGEKRFAEYQLAASSSASPGDRPHARQAEVSKHARAQRKPGSPSSSVTSEVAVDQLADANESRRIDVPILRALAKDRPVVLAATDIDVNGLQALTLEASVPMQWERVDPEDTGSLTSLVTRARNWEIAALVIVRTDRDEGWATALSDIVRASGIAVVTVADGALETLTDALVKLDRAVAGDG